MAKTGKPNILFIMADDIGWFNLSCYNHGVMGYRTPNMDRIAREGAMFTDFYGQQSCTAGRAAFLTGQQPIRTGLTKVGMPGAALGIKAEDVTIAQVLKGLGYATGQFGKNHLGDRNEHLPTVHGIDEFFGNLYHLNAEEEPEYVDYRPTDQEADGDGGRGVPGRRRRLHGAQDERERAMALLLQPHAHARVHASEAVVGGQDRARPLPGRDGRARWLRR